MFNFIIPKAMKLQSKYRKVTNQKQVLLKAFSQYPKTMLEVATMTGIERSYVCWRLSDLQKTNLIEFCGYRLCKISKHRAGTYKTKEK